MGEGNDELGRALIKGFLFAPDHAGGAARHSALYNGGAHLTCECSDSLEDLRTLEAQGVEIPDLRHLPGLLRPKGAAGGGRGHQYVRHCGEADEGRSGAAAVIYFDQAATTLPKPEAVARACAQAVLTGGNGGRGGAMTAPWTACAPPTASAASWQASLG